MRCVRMILGVEVLALVWGPLRLIRVKVFSSTIRAGRARRSIFIHRSLVAGERTARFIAALRTVIEQSRQAPEVFAGLGRVASFTGLAVFADDALDQATIFARDEIGRVLLQSLAVDDVGHYPGDDEAGCQHAATKASHANAGDADRFNY